MNKEIISDKQAICIMLMYICGNALISATGREAQSNIWMAIILALGCAFLLVLIYNRILTLYPSRDLFYILEKSFGRFLGKAICIMYIWYFFYLLVIDLLDFMTFINIVGLSKTPRLLSMILAMMLTSWGTKQGIEVLGRWSEFFVIILFFLVYMIIPLEVYNMDIRNLRTFLDNGIAPVIKGGFSVFSFPFAEIVIFLALFDSLKNKKSHCRVYILGLLFGGIIIFSTAIAEILVLGESMYSGYFFPSYSSVSEINIKSFIRGLEIGVSAAFLITGYVKSIVCLSACCKGISKLFCFDDYRFIVTPIAICIILVSIISFENIIEMNNWKFNIYNYYAFPFQVIIPIIIWIRGETMKAWY
ncbi:GerAB/ArcD/ProY family transporter [Tepidibacter hydrothermalis]|uniref:Endospore germination permease n=1 Tax=Tepidibacter hydrothermalis TaxID=3036126 RepID=A0ABY8EFV8_9FIRM|nr:endospore germination permease [Tepidibacter hydrothermalis]WFD09735.1 endospore germination permease [Tepidibacter hydrothermalis]